MAEVGGAPAHGVLVNNLWSGHDHISQEAFQTLASPTKAPEVTKGRPLTPRNRGELLKWGASLGERIQIRQTASLTETSNLYVDHLKERFREDSQLTGHQRSDPGEEGHSAAPSPGL